MNGDSAEQDRAEAALRESEKRFRAIFEQAPLGIALVESRTGRFVEINRSYCEIVGRTQEEMLRLDYQSITHPETLQADIDNLARVIEGQVRFFSSEKRYVRPDGSTVWVNLTVVALWDEGKRPRFHLAMVADVTERKRAEEGLRKAHDELEQRVEERTAELTRANEEIAIFRRFAEASGQGFGMGDLESRIVYVNPALCRLMGEDKPEDLVGRGFWLYYPEEWQQRRTQEILPALEREGHWEGELPLLSRQGKLIPTLHHIFLLRDGEGRPYRRALVVTDITQQKQAEDALRASTERYELAVQGAGVGIWDWDIRTGKVYYSPRWKMLFGYDQNDIGDSVEDWAKLLHPDERDWILRFQDDFLAGTSSTVTAEYRLRHKDGSYRWIMARGIAVRDEQGRACRLVGSHGDITARKRAEEALERERRTLKHMLEASDHERRLIAYDIHDGLAQELAGAMMHFQIYAHARQENPGDAAKAFDSAMAMLRQSHVEARRLISGVRPPILDESGVMAAIAHLVYDPAFDSGAKIDFRNKVAFKRLAPVLENAIYRIVQEGLTNARNHSQSKKILVSLKQRGDRLRIEVCDWGVGFDPKTVMRNHFGLEGIRERPPLGRQVPHPKQARRRNLRQRGVAGG